MLHLSLFVAHEERRCRRSSHGPPAQQRGGGTALHATACEAGQLYKHIRCSGDTQRHESI